MANETKAQYSFNAGQVDRVFYRRVEEALYWQSAKRLENFFVTSQGNALKRNGTVQNTNVTTNVAGQGNVKFFTRYIYSPTNSLIRVAILLVNNTLFIGAYGKPITFQTVGLSDYTITQAQEASFIVVKNSIVILHKEIAPHRIVYNGTTFSQSLFEFSQQPTFDLEDVDYSQSVVTVTAGATISDPVTILFTGTPWGATPTEFIGGVIVGPGPDKDSPFGTGIIENVTIVGSDTQFDITASRVFSPSSGSVSFKGSNFSVQKVIFTDALGYPSIGGFFQSRLWLGGHPAVPITVFGSMLGTQNNFNVGVGDPTDAIAYTSDIQGTGNFVHFSVGKHFEIFATEAELSVSSNSNGGLSQSTMDLKYQTGFKISLACPPVNFQNYTFFAGSDGKSIYSFRQTIAGEDTYTTKCESLFSSSLISNPQKLVAFFGVAGSSIMLAVLNDDNSLVIFQLSQPLNIAGWTPYTVIDDVTILDIDSDGTSLLFLTKYQKTQTYMLESLDLSAQSFVDSAIAVSLPVSSTPATITGLEVFNGYTVSVGNAQEHLGDYLVAGGEITLNNAVEHAFEGFVGFFYVPVLEPMDLVEVANYNYAFKAVNTVYVDYQDSLAIIVNGQEIPYQNFESIESGAQLSLQSGTFELFDQKGWERFQSIVITQTKPVRMEIISLAYSINNAGR